MSTTTAQRATSATGAANAGYRTLWRWHFYAGLFVMPFLVVLAIRPQGLFPKVQG